MVIPIASHLWEQACPVVNRAVVQSTTTDTINQTHNPMAINHKRHEPGCISSPINLPPSVDLDHIHVRVLPELSLRPLLNPTLCVKLSAPHCQMSGYVNGIPFSIQFTLYVTVKQSVNLIPVDVILERFLSH
jgi:hypothetical protein